MVTEVPVSVQMRVSRPVMPRLAGSRPTTGVGRCACLQTSSIVGSTGGGGGGGGWAGFVNGTQMTLSGTSVPSSARPIRWYIHPSGGCAGSNGPARQRCERSPGLARPSSTTVQTIGCVAVDPFRSTGESTPGVVTVMPTSMSPPLLRPPPPSPVNDAAGVEASNVRGQVRTANQRRRLDDSCPLFFDVSDGPSTVSNR